MEGSYGSKYGLGAIPEEGNSVSVYMCKHAIVRVHKNDIVSVHLCFVDGIYQPEGSATLICNGHDSGIFWNLSMIPRS